MNRAFSSVVKSLSAAVLLASSLSAIAPAASASEAVTAGHTVTATAPAKADPAKGEALFANGDAARGIVACASCHGAAGNSTIVDNPKLAGQHSTYVAKQLHNFTGPERNNPVMTAFAKSLTPEDMNNIAAYVSAQKPKAGAAKNKGTIELGKRIYRAGIAEKNVPACAGCHSPNGAGIPAQFPRLAGQHQKYTVAQLTNFSKDTRKNSAQMGMIAKRMSIEEYEAVADYIAGMK